VLAHLAEHRVGIQWVGGEPTMNPLLYEAAAVACAAGVQQCLFTNGSLLAPKRVDQLLDSRLVFVRVSLDVADPAIHRSFHGYAEGRDFASKVLRNLSYLVQRKVALGSPTLVGVSIVVDERNLEALPDTVGPRRGGTHVDLS